MKFPILPILLIAIVLIFGGIVAWKNMSSDTEINQDIENVSGLDGDGDYDGDPIEVPEEDESTETSVDTSPTPTPSPTPAPTPTPTPKPTPSGYTMTEVAAHASAESCWTAIEGNVYDLTSWISKHPGGKSAILRLCGKDGTDAFNAEHGGDARPERELASFKIGALI